MLTHRHPILRLIIPMLIGMGGAFLFHDTIVKHPIYLLSLLIILAIASFYCHVKNNVRSFIIFSSLAFMTFGLNLTSRSISKAKEQYGDKWTYELHTNNPFQSTKALEVQKKLHDTYKEHDISGEEGSIIEAMTIGWRQGLTKETKDCFSKAGLSHTLALSGFHITIVFMLLHYIFLGKIVTHKWRIISNIFSVACLWAYAFMAGMQPSLVRATIMCSLIIFTQSLGRKVSTLNSCLITGVTMLIFEPLMLFHIGFQLSFAAVIGICTLGDTLCKRFKINTKDTSARPIKHYALKILNGAKDIIIISLVCNIFTVPIVAYNFHQIPLLSIFSNLAATLLVTVLIITSAIWWSTLWCTPLLKIVYNILMWTSSTICTIAHTIASIPYSVYHCKPTILECIFMYGIIITLTLVIRKNSPHRLMAFLSAIILFCIIAITTVLIQ